MRTLALLFLLSLPCFAQPAPVESRVYTLTINSTVLDYCEPASVTALTREAMFGAKIYLCAGGCRWTQLNGMLLVAAPDELLEQVIPDQFLLSRVESGGATGIEVQGLPTVTPEGPYVGRLVADVVGEASSAGYDMYIAKMDDYVPAKPIPMGDPAGYGHGNGKVVLTIIGGLVAKAEITEKVF